MDHFPIIIVVIIDVIMLYDFSILTYIFFNIKEFIFGLLGIKLNITTNFFTFVSKAFLESSGNLFRPQTLGDFFWQVLDLSIFCITW